MKILIVMLIIHCAICTQAQQNKPSMFAINANFKNAKNAKVYLYRKGDGKAVDSTLAGTAGQFNFKGTVEQPTAYYFVFKGTRAVFNFFLDVDKYTITGDVKDPDKLVVHGGMAQVIFQEYQRKLQNLNKLMHDMQLPLKYMSGTADQAQFSNLIYITTVIFRDSTTRMQANFVKKYPASPVSLYVMKYLVGSLAPNSTLDSLMKQIESTPARNFADAKNIRALIDAKSMNTVDRAAADFEQPDPTGKTFSLGDFRGKYVLLDFWASWCAPCRKENPNVLQVYNKYKEKNFTVVAVSIDEQKSAWLKAIGEDKLPWTQLSDLKKKNTAAAVYGVSSLPANFLINPAGKIIGYNLRGEALEEAVQKALAFKN